MIAIPDPPILETSEIRGTSTCKISDITYFTRPRALYPMMMAGWQDSIEINAALCWPTIFAALVLLGLLL